MADEIVNRVATSSLVTFDLEEFYVEGRRVFFDIKDFLFNGLILREKEFREQLRLINWSEYQNTHVAIGCSADAIVPVWAFMLVASNLQPVATTVFFGSLQELESNLFFRKLEQVEWEKFRDSKVTIKGCSKVPVPESAYVEVINRLRPLATSIMFGEACSTIPLFKRKL